MAQVVLENLVKDFSGKNGATVRAVNGIHLTVADGEFMVLVGPSGCGKSTTLRMVAGLETVTSGTIRIGDRVVNAVPPRDRDVAMVFQNYALYPHLTVFDNLAFGLKLRGVPRAEIRRRVDDAAQLLDIAGLLDRKPKALSGGQRQRVAVGRAIVRQPQVFLFDEPLSNLDAPMRIAMRGEIVRLHARLGATMIYVTHDQTEAMTMGDRICVLQGGDIRQVAPPLELYRQPADLFVAAFIGSPPMNVFRGRIETDDATPAFRSFGPESFRLALAGRPAAVLAGREVVLGIRPEDIRDAGPAPAAGAFPAVVEIVEPLGAETFLHLRCGEQALVARLHGSTSYAVGQTVNLVCDVAQAHLFDPATQRVLGSAG